MAEDSIVVSVRFAWWVPAYLHTLAFLCAAMGTEPGMGKVEATLKRGIRVKLVPARTAAV